MARTLPSIPGHAVQDARSVPASAYFVDAEEVTGSVCPSPLCACVLAGGLRETVDAVGRGLSYMPGLRLRRSIPSDQ